MVEPHSSNFRVITTNFLGVRIFRKDYDQSPQRLAVVCGTTVIEVNNICLDAKYFSMKILMKELYESESVSEKGLHSTFWYSDQTVQPQGLESLLWVKY